MANHKKKTIEQLRSKDSLIDLLVKLNIKSAVVFKLSTSLQAGGYRMIEDLEIVLKCVTFGDKFLRDWSSIKK